MLNEMNVKTGLILQKARKIKKMSQANAAEAVGKSRIWLSDVENGKISIYWNDLKRLIELYEISITDFE